MPGKLNAGDVLNMEYLRGIARDHDLAYSTDPRRALEIFAYEVVEAASADEQNRILRELLARMTSGHSSQTNRDVLKYLAGSRKECLSSGEQPSVRAVFFPTRDASRLPPP
jgi:hypothetical protein